MAFYVIVLIAALIVLWVVSVYNGLVRRKNVVREAWSGIDVQLKRRADLIPNLVETVKGYATHERGTFDELTRLRAKTGKQDIAERAQTEAAIQGALDRLMRESKRTAIVIAQRLSTVRDANRIVVLDAGKVVAQGTWDELLATSEVFNQILGSQLQPASSQGAGEGAA